MVTDRGEMTRRQRIEAVLAGRPVDRPPFTFWYHFPADQVAGEACARAHLDHCRRHRLDFLKMMNDNGYPAPEGGVASVEDLERFGVEPVERREFQDQLDALRIVRDELAGETLFITTLFNPLSVLNSLCDKRAVELIRADERAAGRALGAIAATLADFARACIRAGAAGVFMSCSDRELNAKVGPGAYARVVKPHDLAIFNAVADVLLNVLHVHEKADDFASFLDYPVAAVNWADRTDGPSIPDARDRVRPVLMCGMDHVGTIATGSPDDVAREVHDAIRQAAGKPLIIAPGCSFPSDAPEGNLQAVFEALANWKES